MARVILIDDDALMRELLRRGLCAEGLDVEAFGSGAEAIASAVAAPPDAVVADADLPDVGGVALAARLRERGVSAPVVLMTARPSPELEARAARAGVRRVLRKRADGFAELWAVVRACIAPAGADEAAFRLDELRLEFLTDLSHQLRTPVTALGLALDGLLEHLRDPRFAEQRRLAETGRRNVDRIVGLVESQLALLHRMVGATPVARRLVDLRAVAGEAVERFRGRAGAVARLSLETPRDPAWAFTDPGALGALLDGALHLGPPAATRRVRVEADPERDGYRVTVTTRLLDGAGGDRPAGAAIDFESRAHTVVMRRIGGTADVSKDADGRCVRLLVPRTPAFDRRKDFLEPVRSLRAAVSDRRGSVVLIKCELPEGVDPLGDDPRARDLVDRVSTATSDGDAFLRGRVAGTYYLALVDRRPEEVDHVRAFLRAAGGTDGVYVSQPHTIVPDGAGLDELVPEPEPEPV